MEEQSKYSIRNRDKGVRRGDTLSRYRGYSIHTYLTTHTHVSPLLTTTNADARTGPGRAPLFSLSLHTQTHIRDLTTTTRLDYCSILRVPPGCRWRANQTVGVPSGRAVVVDALASSHDLEPLRLATARLSTS